MAITFNNKAVYSYNNSTGNYSTSYTVGSGSNRVLVVMVMGNGATPSGVTYGGVSMVMVDSVSANPVWFATFILYAPASGSNTLNISANWYNNTSVYVYDYSDVAQTNTPNAHVLTNSTTISITPTVNNCLVIGMGANQNSSPFISGLPNNRQGDGGYTNSYVGDSGVLATTSAYSFSFSGPAWGTAICLAPYAPPNLANLKTYNKNTKANTKSINTNLISNAKTLNTIT